MAEKRNISIAMMEKATKRRSASPSGAGFDAEADMRLDGFFAGVCRQRRFRLGNAVEELEQWIHVRQQEDGFHPVADPGQHQLPAVLLTRHVRPQQATQARRIEVRHPREIQNQDGRSLGAKQSLELKERGDGKRPAEMDDDASLARPGRGLNLQLLIRHAAKFSENPNGDG